ncbi:hypothetical protein DFS34DRAFT_652311 [Phlyctochytrium arcticum]|nr:hypothetical protein DFS34DRAFT_652311 [Phlyctochytrium arcticum]
MKSWYTTAFSLLAVWSIPSIEAGVASLFARQVIGDTSLPANTTPLSTTTVPVSTFTYQDAKNGVYCGSLNIVHDPNPAYFYPSTTWSLDLLLNNAQVWWISNAVADVWQDNQGSILRATPIAGMNDAVAAGGWVEVGLCYNVVNINLPYSVMGRGTFGTTQKIVIKTTTTTTTTAPTPIPTTAPVQKPTLMFPLPPSSLKPLHKRRDRLPGQRVPEEDPEDEETDDENGGP